LTYKAALAAFIKKMMQRADEDAEAALRAFAADEWSFVILAIGVAAMYQDGPRQAWCPAWHIPSYQPPKNRF